MFYPEDFILSKKGSSLGIIWLMGTLGPRDKKLGRNSKAISNVKISRVCDDIAEPPEPMSLRLSSHLLVGVTRVYGRNYGIFASEVQNFHTLLRRSEATLASAKGASGGIDLPGGGISRLDQITFAAFNPEIDAITDFDFGFINWNDPEFGTVANNRKRRASSKLSSLQAQPTQEASDDDDEDDLQDNTGRTRSKRRRTGTPLFLNSQDGGSYRHDGDEGDLDPILKDPLDQPEYEPLDLGLEGDLFMPPSDDFSTGNMFDGPGDFGMLDMDFNPENQTPAPASKSAMKRKTADGDSSEAASEVEDQIELNPKVKKTRKKKVKRVTFDDDIEFNLNQTNYGGYVAEMARQKEVVDAKKRDKDLDIKAKALVEGGGLWITYLDEDMAAWFAAMAKPPQFGWETEDQSPGSRKTTPEKTPSQEERPEQGLHDVFGEMQLFGDDNPFMEMNDLQMPASDDAVPRRALSEATDEVGRRFSQHSQQLPWDDIASSDFGGPDYGDGLRSSITPMSARISLMTPLERRIRSGNATRTLSGPAIHQRNRRQRSRSGSLLSHMEEDEELMLFPGNDDDDDRELPDHNISASQLYDENDRNPFSPVMLAMLEAQCRSFFTFVETRMISKEVDELEFDDVVDDGATKRVAAAAFYNCLTLATKAILSVHQPERPVPNGNDDDEAWPGPQPITIRIAPRAVKED